MHKRYFSLLLLLSLSFVGFAQIALPLDFESPAADYTFEGFEGADSAIEMNPDQTGENTSATVMRSTKTDGAAFFAGTTVTLDTPIDFSSNKGISIQTWSPKANIPVRLKLENADASAFVELDVNTTVANAWETLTFDLESRLDPTVSYTKVIVFFEFINGQAGDGSTYYYDNVQTADVSGGVSVGLPVDFENMEATYDIVGFEGANVSVVANPDQSGENTSATVVQHDKTDGAAFFAGATLTLDEAIDFSTNKGISISSWSPKADIPVRVKIENADASVFAEVDVNTTTASAWETMVFDFSNAPAAQYTKVIIFYEFIVDLPGDGSTYYYDNIATVDVGGGGGSMVTLPVDFELTDVTYGIFGFEGAASAVEANPDQSGENTSATVVRTTKTDGAQFFAGTTLELDAPIDFSTDKGISISTWSPKADIPVRIKIENADASVFAEVDVNTTVASAWETLTFDFSNAPAADYVKVIVFFEFIVDLAGDGSTYYYDNIAVAPVDGGGPQVALPVDFESMELTYRLTGFEGADSAVEANPDQTGENTSATVVRTTKTDGAQFFAGTTLELDVPIDFSTDQGISIQTWSPKADIPVRVKIENADASVFAEVDVNTTVANAWETLTFDFSNAPAGTYTKVIVFFEFIADLAGDGSTYYYDNIAVAAVDGGGPQVALPVDFESMELTYRLTGFEGADSAIETNPDQTGANTSATVVRTTKTDGAAFFAGTTLELDVPIDFSTDQGISIQTWSPKADIPVRVKIENADASVFAEVDVNTTVANAWETLTFDFSNAPAGTYTKVIVFFEFIADLAGDGSTYYYDNIATASVDGGGGGNEVVLPVTFEDDMLNYNPIGFEGADSAVEANPDQTGVNPTATVVRTTKTDGAQFFAGTTIELDQPIDLSNTGMLFIDTWSPKANIPVRVKIENADASVFAEVDVNTTTASAWETLMYDFSSAPAADYVKVIVFFEFVPDLAGDGTTYYFDNINVDRAVSVTNLTAEQVQVFPNPTSNLWEVNSPEARIEILDLFNMNGQRILTATPDANQFQINATELPNGTYVLRVMTAEGRRITRLVKQ